MTDDYTSYIDDIIEKLRTVVTRGQTGPLRSHCIEISTTFERVNAARATLR